MHRQTETDKLQKYLDEQILAFSTQPKEKPSFDSIENKLLRIQQKLLGLKSQSQRKFTASFAQQTSLAHPSRQFSIKTSQAYIFTPTKEPQLKISEDAHKPLWTPAKQLNIVSKTMSAAHIGTTSMNGTMKKSKKKANTTAKKKEQTVQSLTHLGAINQNKWKYTPTKSTGKKSSNLKEPERQVRLLQKQLEQYQKANANLVRRMNDLRSYENEFSKLKQIFDRCEQLRRRTRLNRNKT